MIDYCIYDTGEIIPEFIRKYNKKGQDLVETDTSVAKEEGIKLIQRNLSYIDGEFIRHNPDVIASSIIELVVEDMKFRDMENDSRFVMLNSRLKDTKKKIKETTTDVKKEKTKKSKGVSKFVSKYQERIDSIRYSDDVVKRKKIEKNIQQQQRENSNELKFSLNSIKEKINSSKEDKKEISEEKIPRMDRKKIQEKTNNRAKQKKRIGKHS